MAFLALLQSEFFMTTVWRWLINLFNGFIGNYGWCVVVFTVCLKLLLSPLDFFNRKKSYDNKRLMRRMRPEMERLDKQYAADQRTLMLKKRELQKKYGYGMGATCLTTIVTFFIFITLWTGFTTISKEMNVAAYEDLQATYTRQEVRFLDALDPIHADDATGLYSIAAQHDAYWADYVARYKNGDDYRKRLDAFQKEYVEQNGEDAVVPEELLAQKTQQFAEEYFLEQNKIGAFDATLDDDDYYAVIRVHVSFEIDYLKTADYRAKVDAYRLDHPDGDLDAYVAANREAWANAYFTGLYGTDYTLLTTDGSCVGKVKTLRRPDLALDDARNIVISYSEIENATTRESNIFKQAALVVQFAVRPAVADRYDEIKESWLWVKNVWRPDTWKSPILSFTEYKTLTGTNPNELRYKLVISPIEERYGSAWNGYLVLVVLTVGLNLLNQWLMMRQQKQSGEAEMAGAGSGTVMKVMMIIMPIMLGFFALQYASAFTIYMVTNAFMTLALFGLSALILGAREKKLDAEEARGYFRAKGKRARAAKNVKTAKTGPAYNTRPSYDRSNLPARTAKKDGRNHDDQKK